MGRQLSARAALAAVALATACAACHAAESPDPSKRKLLEEAVAAERWGDAAAILRELVEAEPRNGRLRFVLGEACRRTDDALGAYVSFSAYLNLEPFAGDRSKVEEMLGLLQELLLGDAGRQIGAGAYAKADEILKALEQRNPRSAALFYNRAVCLAKLGDPLEAYARLLLSIHLKPDVAGKDAVRNSQEAIYAQLLERGYGAEALMRYLDGRRAILDGKYDKAAESLGQAMDLMPWEGDFRYQRSLAHACQGQGLLAVTWLASSAPLFESKERRAAVGILLPSLTAAVKAQEASIVGSVLRAADGLPEADKTAVRWHALEAAARAGAVAVADELWTSLRDRPESNPCRDRAIRALVDLKVRQGSYDRAREIVGKLLDATIRDEVSADLLSVEAAGGGYDSRPRWPYKESLPCAKGDIGFDLETSVPVLLDAPANVRDDRLSGLYRAKDLLKEAARIDDKRPRCRALMAMAARFIEAGAASDATMEALGRATDLAGEMDWGEGRVRERGLTFARLARLWGQAGEYERVLGCVKEVADARLREEVLVDACFDLAGGDEADVKIRSVGGELSPGTAARVAVTAALAVAAARDPVKALALRNEIKAAAKAVEGMKEPEEKRRALVFLARAQAGAGMTSEALKTLERAEGMLAGADNTLERAVLCARMVEAYRATGRQDLCSRAMSRAEAELWRGLSDGSEWRGLAWGRERVVYDLREMLAEAGKLRGAEAAHSLLDAAILLARARDSIDDARLRLLAARVKLEILQEDE